MKNITKISIVAFAFISLGANAQTKPAGKFGQQQLVPCGTTEYEHLLQQRDPERPGDREFEEWLAPKVEAARAKRLMQRGANQIVTIPVVVHVIHDGDAIGEDENITDGQILSQITVLNQDFGKMAGTPGHNTNPAGADTEIRFCLAQRDPQGVMSTGINRYAFGNNAMTRQQVEILKTFTQWDPEKYLNIWVVRSITTEDGQELAGYAQFPTSSGLPGLSGLGVPTAANTDGVVLAYAVFGSEDIYPQGTYWPGNEKGRVAVHEIGHFFGLRHIWGDGNCTATDFCADTPAAAAANTGCPPQGWDSCPQSPGTDMFRNYMDYTNDICQDIFTLNQKDRMQAVLENSPRRESLTTSDGCVPGMVFDNEGSLEIPAINAQCNTSFTPQVRVTNSGSNTITSVAIAYNIDDTADQVFNWTGSIAVGQEAVISLPQINAAAGPHYLNARLQLVNGQQDAVPDNDIRQQNFALANTFNTTVVRVRIVGDNFPAETLWRIRNSNNAIIATSQGPAVTGQETITNVNVVNGECYTFEMTDANGDGMCCNFGFGYYLVETPAGIIIAEGGQFGSREVTRFKVNTSMGIDEVTAMENVKLYPNPADGLLNISIPEGLAVPQAYTIYNSLGQVVAQGKIAGSSHAVDVSAFAQGVYMVKLSTADSSQTLRFIKK